MPPLFDRYGEFPDEPIAEPDPGFAQYLRKVAEDYEREVAELDELRAAEFQTAHLDYRCVTVTHHSGTGTTLVLHPLDELEVERQERWTDR